MALGYFILIGTERELHWTCSPKSLDFIILYKVQFLKLAL